MVVSSYSGQFGGTMCSPTDQTFYCKLSRFTGEAQMIFSLLFIPLLLIYYLYKLKKTKK